MSYFMDLDVVLEPKLCVEGPVNSELFMIYMTRFVIFKFRNFHVNYVGN